MMQRDDRRDLMMLYALGALDAPEQEQARAQLASGDPEAVADLAHAQAVLAHLPLALDRADPPATVKDQLLQRVRAHATDADQPDAPQTPAILGPIPGSPPESRTEPAGFQRFHGLKKTPWGKLALASGVAAVLAMAITAFTFDQRLDQQHQEIVSLQQQVQRRDTRLGSMQLRLDSANRILGMINNAKGSLSVALNGADPQPDAHGWLLYDPDQAATVFLSRGMKPPKPGQVYQLWLVTADQRKVSVGTFEVDDQGRTSLTTQLDHAPARVAMAAVTNEPAGGSPQPTGDFQMLGKFQ